MTNLIVDASVAVKWFIDEEGSAQARDIAWQVGLAAPDLILAETYSAIAKRIRRKEARVDQLDSLVALLKAAIGEFLPLAQLIEDAAALAKSLDHPIYDCVYLAHARHENASLITADQRQFAVAKRARIPARML